MPPALIDEAVLQLLTRVFATAPQFEHRLVRTSWFGDDILWLAPEDESPFHSLTDAVQRKFPDYPPFGGQFENVVPHLTIADRRPLQQMRSAERDVQRHLPIDCVAAGVTLMVQRDASRAWTRSAQFPLGASPSWTDSVT